MNPMLKALSGILFAVLLVLVAPAAHAFPFTAGVNGPANLSLVEGLTATIPIDINNVDFQSHHVVITTSSNSGFVDADVILDEFDMAPYQFTQVGVSISASEDAEHDTYVVNVKVLMDGQETTIPVTVYVGTNPFLTVNPFSKNVCGGEFVENLTVSVKNNAAHIQSALIHAEQPILFPTFEDENVSLGAGETQLVMMAVNVSPQNAGTYDGTITARTNEVIVVRPFSVKVNDCPAPIPKTISLELPKKPKDLVKNQDNLIPIKVKNLTDVPQSVSIFTDSDIPAGTIEATIGPKETATLNLVFTPGYDVPAGSHPVQVTAIASGYSTSQTMTLKVLPIDLLEWQSITSAYNLNRGQTKTIALILHNRGDSTQNVSFAMQHAIPGIDFTFNPAAGSVEKYKSIVVQVSISVREDTSVTRVNTNIQAIGSKSTANAPLAFNVGNANESDTQLLEFVSVPKFVQMGKDAHKEIVVTIQNTGDESISGVHFKLGGVKGASISVVGPANTVIAPHEAKTITLTLVTQEDTLEGAYSPILIAEGKNALGTAPFSLQVGGNDGLGLLSGLVTFVGERAALLGLAILLVILGVWVYNRARASPTDKEPVWTGKSN